MLLVLPFVNMMQFVWYVFAYLRKIMIVYVQLHQHLLFFYFILSSFLATLSSTTPTTTMGSCPVSTGFTWRLHLNITHVYLLVHQQHRSPLTLLSPVLWVGGLVDINNWNFSSVIFDPISSPLVHNSHEISSTIMVFMITSRWGSMEVISLMQDNPNKSEFASRFRILERLEPKLMINISRKQDMIQILIIQLILPQLIRIYIDTKIHATLSWYLGNLSSIWYG